MLDSNDQKLSNNISRISKSEKYKITYNKKAESEFFVDNSALAGFTGERILYMAVRELLENALDSCESFSILPSITVSLKIFDQSNDLWILSCKDNGTGISTDKLPVAVCSFLTSAKYMEKQQRGLFGVGLKMVAAFSTKDTDYPVKVWNKSINESEECYFELRTDIGTNKPIVLKKKTTSSQDSQINSPSGFKIEVILRARLVPITKNKIYEYVTETSIVNPYSSIAFETDDGVFHFDRRTSIMPQPAQEILPHPSDMDLKTLKKAISKFNTQKISLPKILASSFQKLSYEKSKELVTKSGLDIKRSNDDYGEHDLIKIVNMCKKTKFQNPNTDHLSPIGQDILTIGMMSEYTIVPNKGNDSAVSTNSNLDQSDLVNNDQSVNHTKPDPRSQDAADDPGPTMIANKNNSSKSNFSIKVLKPVLTAYTSRTCVINNRPTIIETGLAYGGDIPSFKLYRFANKIPLLYDEGSDVAREVISEVQINKMGITKKQAKEQFSTTNKESKKDRVIEVLPLHIFFHVCSTKIPYKTAGKESIASEGELKYYMKSCLSELYRKLSTQIRKELKLKEAENKLRLYKHYLPFIVNSINESLGINNSKLGDSFSKLIENHLNKRSNLEENTNFTTVPDSNVTPDHTISPILSSASSSTSLSNISTEQSESVIGTNNQTEKSSAGNNKSKKDGGDRLLIKNATDKNKNKNNHSPLEISRTLKKNPAKTTNVSISKKRNVIDRINRISDTSIPEQKNIKNSKAVTVENNNDGINPHDDHRRTKKSVKATQNINKKKFNVTKQNYNQPKNKGKQSLMSLYDKRVNKGKKK